MRLTSRIVWEHLSEHFSIVSFAGIGLSEKLDGPMLFDSGQTPEDGWVYVCPEHFSGIALPAKLKALLIFTDRNEAISERLPAGCSMICVDAPLGAVFTVLAHLFSEYREWAHRLEQIQFAQGGAEEMLQASLPLLKNPILLMHRDLSLEAYAAHEICTIEVKHFIHGTHHMEMVNAITQDAQYKENRKKEEPYWGPDYITGFRLLCVNIRKHHALTYSLMLAEDQKKLTEADMDRLEILGYYMSYALYNQGRRGKGKDEDLRKVLINILSDRTFDYVEASRQLRELGWKETDAYLCLLFQLTYLDQNALPSASICNYMEEQYSGCAAFSYGNDIVCYFNLDQAEYSYDELLTRLKPFIRDSYLKAGFSRIVNGHMNLRRQYVQAGIALDVGGRVNPYVWIHYFDQNAMRYIEEQITRRLPAGMICHEGVLRLRAHDLEHGSAYIETLRTYLDTNQNAVRSSKELFIHRSTFLYRIEKIREILDSTLDDPEENLYIALSIRLLERKDK